MTSRPESDASGGVTAHRTAKVEAETDAMDRASQIQQTESRTAAKGGVIGFIGAATSSGLGFALTILITRLLGEHGAGIVLQAMAVFSIAVSMAKFGMDSVAIWIVPHMVEADPQRLRQAVRTIYGITVGTGVLGGLCVIAWSRLIHIGDPVLATAVLIVGLAVPIGALQLVSLSIIRGLGDLWAYVLIGNIALPVLRPVAVGIFAILGSTALGVTIGWLTPLPLAFVAAAIFGIVIVGRAIRSTPNDVAKTPRDRQMVKKMLGFALPRTVSAGLEQSIQWLDILIVGAIAGSAAAGIYGGASRFISAGLIIDAALRVVVSPRFSALLHEKRIVDLQKLYRDSAIWLVLFSTPVFVVLVLNARTVLAWLGPGFTVGATALMLLCAGVTVTLMAGNIHSVLLMSGRSNWAAMNKTAAVAINVTGNILLVPHVGIIGAACSWVASMLVDAVLASIEVRRFIGVRLEPAPLIYALLPAVVCFGGSGIAWNVLIGPGLPMLVADLLIGGGAFLLWCRLDRRRLVLDDIIAALPRR